MYSFYSSILKRYYPTWSKIRKDESSNGSSLLEQMGDQFAKARENLLYAQNARNVLQGDGLLNYESVNLYNLNDDSEFLKLYGNSTDRNVAVSMQGDNQSLERIFDLKSFVSREPTRIELFDTLLTNTIIDIEAKDFYEENQNLSVNGEYIYITLDNSSFETDSEYPLYNTVNNNELLEESYYIVVRGLDISHRPLEEVIYVKDQFTYKTRNQFVKLKSLFANQNHDVLGGPAIELVGFSSKFKFSNHNIHKNIERSAYSLAVSDDRNIENNPGYTLDNELLFSIFTETKTVNEIELKLNYLKYFYIPFVHAKHYRNVEDYELKQKILTEQLLISFVQEEVRDFCYDKVRNKIYILNEDLSISIFNIGKSIFSKGTLSRTKNVSLSLESILQRVRLHSTQTLNSCLLNSTDLIGDYIIARETPNTRFTDNNPVNLEFLQADKTWSQDGYVFKSSFSSEKKVFTPDYFDVDFDTLGQWDFYIIEPSQELVTEVLSTQDYNTRMKNIKRLIDSNLKEPVEKIKINRYSILTESNFPEKTYSWAGEQDLNNTYKMYKSGPNNQLKIVDLDTGNIYLLEEHMDYYYLDFSNKIIATIEEYTNATIEYGNLTIVVEGS